MPPQLEHVLRYTSIASTIITFAALVCFVVWLNARSRKIVLTKRRIVGYVMIFAIIASWIPLYLWNQRHDSALLHAIIAHDIQAAQQAFKDGATMKMELKHKSTFFQAAAYQGQVEMAKLLVEHGAATTIDATDDSGQNALDIALANHHLEMADYLRSFATNHAGSAP